MSLTGRSFSYLGIPPAKLFIGDLTLAAFIFLRPRQLFDPWIKALTKGGPLGPLAWILLISISYGIFQVIRGVLLGFSPLIAVENLVFNVYPLYLFLGLWLGKRRPDLLLRFVQVFAVLFCIYAPAYLLVLNKILVKMPGSDGVNVFGQAAGGGFIILSLLCLDPKPGRWWPAMAVAAFAFLAAQVRSEWLGMAVATMIWGVLSKKMTRVAMIGAGIFAVLAVGFLLDVNLPSPGERGGAISSSEIVARGLAAVSPDMARDLTGSEQRQLLQRHHQVEENVVARYLAQLAGELHQSADRSRIWILAQEPGELPQRSGPAHAAQCLLLRSRLQRLDRRIDLLLAAGCVRCLAVANL